MQLVVFYRERDDGQMKSADKEIELAATELTTDVEAAVAVALVDTKTCPAAMRKGGIEKGPAIAVFRRGKKLSLGPNSYEARSVVNFVRYLTSPVSRKLEGTTQVNEFLRNATDVVVLGIFADATRPSHNVWVKAAEALRPPYRFAEASYEDVNGAKLFSGTGLDSTKNQYAVVLPHKWVGKDEKPFHLGADFRTMKDFVPEHSLTRVSPLSGATRARWKAQKKCIVGLTLNFEKRGKMFKYILNRVHKLLLAEPELEERFAFTIHDSKHIAGASAEFGVDAGKDFAVTVHNFTDAAYYGTELLCDMSVDNFSALPLAPFLKRIADGEEPPFVKSEDPPSQPAKPGEVAVATGRTFGEVVEDESVDVVLALYAHKAPGDTVRKVAHLFHKLPSLRVAMMNVSSNAFNGSRYRYYGGGQGEEQIFLAPASAAGKAKPLMYEARSVEEVGVAEFVLKHAVVAEPAAAYAEVRKMVKAARKQKDKERDEMFGGLGGDSEKKRKKKRKKKKKKKDEL